MAEYTNHDEILKNLEQYREHTLLAFDGDIPQIEIRDILGVIYRQKAEIEILKESIKYGNEICEECQGDKDKGLKNARKNAIKEFAERLKERAHGFLKEYNGVNLIEIDNLVKEMVGERE